jgi:leader peptidase (prepilin peptidase)/N-methyltransferase
VIPDWAAYALAPFVGSFMGVLIHRLPAGEPVGNARSRCEACGTILGIRDLVPLVSWLAMRGRCRHCGAPIGWFPPVIELATLMVALWAGTIDVGPALWFDCLLGWTLLTLAWIDLRHLLLPDVLNLPLLLVGLASAWYQGWPPLLDAAAGAAIGFLAFRLLAFVYRRLRGREGLGEGDAKLLAVAGAWLGWEALGDVVLVAALLGILGFVLMRPGARPLDRGVEIPFGPALALAIWIVRLYGPLWGL